MAEIAQDGRFDDQGRQIADPRPLAELEADHLRDATELLITVASQVLAKSTGIDPYSEEWAGSANLIEAARHGGHIEMGGHVYGTLGGFAATIKLDSDEF